MVKRMSEEIYYEINGKSVNKKSIEKIFDWVEGLSEMMNPIATDEATYFFFRKAGRYNEDPNIAYQQGMEHALNKVYSQASMIFSEVDFE